MVSVVDTDPRVKALESFKDWSNYLLVTTVAATGWVVQQSHASAPTPLILMPTEAVRAPTPLLPSPISAPTSLMIAAVWCLALSAVFGVFTLALVPLVSEQLGKATSIYKVRASFRVMGIRWSAYLTQACRPQHVLFMAGVLLYAASFVGMSWSAGVIVVGALILGWRSVPKDDA